MNPTQPTTVHPSSESGVRPTRRLFISGTDTDVGKTFVACAMAKHYRHSGMQVGVYKPVASDCHAESAESGAEIVAADARNLWNAAGNPRSLDEVCPQRFRAPLAPTRAAAAEGKSVDADQLHQAAAVWLSGFDVTIIEGAGGLLSPLADGILNLDLAKKMAPVQLVIVAANRLGVIHQTLATCTAAIHGGLTPAGIVLCDTSENLDASADENAAEIARYSPIPILGRVGFGSSETPWADQLLD
ncbi:dethiobiotin synthase [Novipirellula caenicola]|uniref:ATP-dependent dethiobiotin synthetase BioD n=1 Tax=Novipirellula caenicola TaxID=1536901 RepID=A0ABP9VQ39_9BACT